MQSESNVLDPDMEFELSFSGHPLIPGLPMMLLYCVFFEFQEIIMEPVGLFAKDDIHCWATRSNFLHGGRSLGLTTHGFLCLRIINAPKKKSSGRFLNLPASLGIRSPCEDKVCPQGFRCVSIPHEGVLFVCGGMVFDVDCSLN